MHLGLTKSRDDKLLQDLLDKKLRVIVVFEDDYLNHIARIAYKDIQQDNYTYRIGAYNIYKGEEWGFCDFCKRHNCYFIVPNETIKRGSSEIPNSLEEASSKFATHTVSNGVSIEFLEEKLFFQEGAKWQMEQIMKNAKDGWIDEECVIVLNDGTCIDLQPDYDKNPAFEFEYAQNVQVIVLPKEN